jgi:recombination protein RecT
MSTALTPVQKKQMAMRNTLREMLEKGRERFRDSLPEHSPLTVKRLINVALTATTTQPKLFECSMESIAQALLVASQTGLECDGYHAHLVPYKQRCQFIPDYKGLIQLALESDVVIDAYTVHEKDTFEYELGTSPRIIHRPSEDDDRGPMRCAYAVARFPTGVVKFVVATKADILKRKAVSQAKGAEAPWNMWEAEMAQKTAVKMLAKFIPRSRRLDVAIRHDNCAEAGLEQTPMIIDSMAAAISPERADQRATPKTKRLAEKVAADVPVDVSEEEAPLPFDKSEYATALLNAKDSDEVQTVFDQWVECQAAELTQELYDECIARRDQRLAQLAKP